MATPVAEELVIGTRERIEKPTDLFLQALLVNNLTNQWVEIPDVGIFIQPYTSGAIVPLNGTRKLYARINTPELGTGQGPAAPISGQRVALIAFDVPLTPSSGQTMVIRPPSTEWRNPVSLTFFAAGTQVGPQGAPTVMFTYTVPTGRRAQVDTAQVICELDVSDNSLSGTNVEVGLAYFPGGGAGTYFLNAIIHNGTIRGSRADAALPKVKELLATDSVQGRRQNARGGGVRQFYFACMTITEGDA